MGTPFLSKLLFTRELEKAEVRSPGRGEGGGGGVLPYKRLLESLEWGHTFSEFLLFF